MSDVTGKLDQLTSLRFFAALMVVVYHSVGLFGLPPIGANLGQGVSFFFVLSGFILTYVYPRLDDAAAVRKFWRARVARIWPAHVAAFLLGFVLIPYTWDSRTGLANLLMLQAWIPMSSYYFSYNSISWSISTEFFFYLAFPFLIRRWDSTWKVKLALAALIVIALAMLASMWSLPVYGNRGHGSDGGLVTQHGLLYINPLARLLEFVLGMALARAWRNSATKAPYSTVAATGREIGAIAICALTMVYTPRLAAWSRDGALGSPFAVWLENSGSALAFGLLIFVIAKGQGRVSQVLSKHFLVLLGEISYSIYLLHQILLTLYRRYLSAQFDSGGYVTFALFLAFLLLASYLVWASIEIPGRLLLGRGAIHGTRAMRKTRLGARSLGRKPAVAALLLLALVAWVRFGLDRSGTHVRPDPSANMLSRHIIPGERARGSPGAARQTADIDGPTE